MNGFNMNTPNYFNNIGSGQSSFQTSSFLKNPTKEEEFQKMRAKLHEDVHLLNPTLPMMKLMMPTKETVHRNNHRLEDIHNTVDQASSELEEIYHHLKSRVNKV
jgi:hypothetical protein